MWQFLTVRLHRDENASTMVVALASMTFLILALAFPLNLGWNISERIRLQNAADAAAYSAAVTQADALSAINWINNMESYLYHREIVEVKKFCEFATDACLFQWGENDNHSFDGSFPISSAPSNSQAKKWLDKFKNKFNNKNPDVYFKDEIVRKDMRLVYDKFGTGKRTVEIWIRTLSKAAEAIAKSMPRMIRNEATRIAFKNLGKDAIVAVFPNDTAKCGNVTAPVFMNFTPNKTAAYAAGYAKDKRKGTPQANKAADQSFLEYAPWYQSYDTRESYGTDFIFTISTLRDKYEESTGAPKIGTLSDRSAGVINPFVERALQFGDQLGTKYMTNHKVYLPSVDMPAHMMGFGLWENWYDIYAGEPRRRMNVSMQFVPKEMYMGYARTIECWNETDRDEDESGGDGMAGNRHDGNGKPKGHWHHYHLHIHYWCFSIINVFPFWSPPSYHIGPIPWFHRNCNEESRDCDMSWRRWGPKANGVIPIHQWLNTIPLPIDHIMDFVSYVWFDIMIFTETPPAHKQDGKWMGGVNLDSVPFLYMFPEAAIQNLLPMWDHHHCIKACPVCWNHFTGAFNRSWAPHALTYGMLDSILNQPMLHPLMINIFGWDDHDWKVGQNKSSQVRCYLEDALTDFYLQRSDSAISRQNNFHRIFRDNFCPDKTTFPANETPSGGPPPTMTGLLTPTIVLKDSFDRNGNYGPADNHLFKWGIIVAVWTKQISPWLPEKVFSRSKRSNQDSKVTSNPGMLAIAASKVGIIQRIPMYYSDYGTDRYFPNRLITGIGEPYSSNDNLKTAIAQYDAAYFLNNFIKPFKKEQQITNGFQTNWGARLIPIDKSIPADYAQNNNVTPVELVLNSKAYSWPASDFDSGLDLPMLSNGAKAETQPWSTSLNKDQYKKLMDILCH